MIKRLKKEDTILVAIDFQEKLLPAMADAETTEKNVKILIEGANAFGIDKIATTQYAKGLGQTVPGVAEALKDCPIIDKSSFSCWLNDEFRQAVEKAGKKTVVIAGIETHICVEQTALDMVEAGYDVFLAADAANSRNPKNHLIALNRLAAAGVTVTSVESILYDLLGGAKAPEFKTISKLVK